MHEMGEMKRVHELRVDEFSVQKLRESHETIQRLTSQLQDLQDRMTSGIKLQREIVLRFQPACNDSKFFVPS